MEVTEPSVVVAGNLRVLRARLEDARFFFREDAKKGLAARVPELGRVTYIDQLGSVLDRVSRIEALVAPLAEALYPGDADIAATAARAAHLCKADLVTGMVYEFPELQGTMGRYYAAAEGETAAVAEAIEAHYRPRGASDEPATEPAGVVVAMADKLDAIAGCYAVGLVPSGSADPYALRRAALGIVRTAMHHGLRLNIDALVRAALAALPDTVVFDHDVVAGEIVEFIRGRLRALLAADAATDVVDAVVSVTLDDMPAAPRRVEVVSRMRDNADFEPLAAAFKRVVNILRKAVDEGSDFATLLTADSFAVDVALLDTGSEAALFAAVNAAEPAVLAGLDAGNDEAVAERLIALKGPIDAFFDDVMVNTEDIHVRRNRLHLLARVRALFARFADISRIQARTQG
jgi:glycyl-tRNA synthetase beta chain